MIGAVQIMHLLIFSIHFWPSMHKQLQLENATCAPLQRHSQLPGLSSSPCRLASAICAERVTTWQSDSKQPTKGLGETSFQIWSSKILRRRSGRDQKNIFPIAPEAPPRLTESLEHHVSGCPESRRSQGDQNAIHSTKQVRTDITTC